jgi:hypothetical protein
MLRHQNGKPEPDSIMKPRQSVRSALLVMLVLDASISFAQLPTPAPGVGGWNTAMTRLFGDVKAFSARAEMRVLDQADKETMRMDMGFALLDGKVRMEIDMGQMKSALLPPDAGASLKQMGMDRLTTLVLPDKKAIYIIYPGLQAYVDMPLPEEEVAAASKDFKIDKTTVGKESIDGHPCVKNKVVMTDDKGAKREVLVWEAADLKNFPLQMRLDEKGTNIVVRYKNVQFTKPESKQFEAPAGFARHTDFQQLMQVAVQKMLSGAAGKQ